MLRIDRLLAILSGQKVFAKLDLSPMLSTALISVLSEMSTNHHPSGGFLSSVHLVQNFCRIAAFGALKAAYWEGL